MFWPRNVVKMASFRPSPLDEVLDELEKKITEMVSSLVTKATALYSLIIPLQLDSVLENTSKMLLGERPIFQLNCKRYGDGAMWDVKGYHERALDSCWELEMLLNKLRMLSSEHATG